VKILYRWLREFVELELPPAEAADRLVNAGIEVASVTPLRPDLTGVVVGEIEAVERELGEHHGHRLRVCRVTAGGERFTVVCGAPDAAAGLRAAFAPPGARLPGGRRIDVATLHGVLSQGMLCSERELGLGEEHERGLLVLGAGAPVGADLVQYLGLDDTVLEVEVTPNRADCLSVVGVARELAALTGVRFLPPDPSLDEADPPASALARVRIEAPDLCPRFTARVISDVRVGPSPAWLQARLRAVGLRPISNVVDATNYVMWELGQPLHAFDHATVAGATIVVRRARPGEVLTTLDGQPRALDPSMLVISDPERAIAVAGVMGGGSTEVTGETTRVLLESACFAASSIRRTSRALGLATDAAYRFERGADIEGVAAASARAARLIARLAGGTISRGVVDAYPRPRPVPRIGLRMARVQRVLGAAPPVEEARRILSSLGLPVRAGTGPPGTGAPDLEVEVPSFRRDLAIEDDLVEEIVRVWGYDRIPSTLPVGALALVRRPATHRQEDAVRRALEGAGLTEVVTMSFGDPVREAILAPSTAGKAIELLNPLSREASLLRRNLLEGALEVTGTNLRRQQPSVRVFEVGKTYEQRGDERHEARWVAVVLAGARTPTAWYAPDQPADAYDVKGLAEHVLQALAVPFRAGRAGESGAFDRVFEADCYGTLVGGDGTVLAEFGELSPAVRGLFQIEIPAFGALVALDGPLGRQRPAARHQALPRFPAVQRDLAFLVEPSRAALAAADVEAALQAEAGPLLRDLRLFDVFRFPDGRRNLAWRLTLQADDRTLTDDEVNAILTRVAGRVADRFHITLRGT
jgi:phenylalanyl-tRNA synthetase beta chain